MMEHTMTRLDTDSQASRAGKQYRSNPDRYFHVMAEGWYIFTREGVRGPFLDKPRAATYLKQHIQGGSQEQGDPSASWRL